MQTDMTDATPAPVDILALFPPLLISVRPGTLERFAAKIEVDPDSGCWHRMPDPVRKGYGRRIRLNGDLTEAHVASYLMFVGPIPEGYSVDHVCHDPFACTPGPSCPHRCCVNPAHFEAVPGVVNILRGGGPSAINARKTHCKRGHEFTPENTYIERGGSRRCLTCMKAASLARSEGTLGAYNRAKTHCKQGHPYDEANTYVNAKGRACKTCTLASTRRRRARLRAERAA